MTAINVRDYSWVNPRYLGIPSKHVEKDGGIEVVHESHVKKKKVEAFWSCVERSFGGYYDPLSLRNGKSSATNCSEDKIMCVN